MPSDTKKSRGRHIDEHIASVGAGLAERHAIDHARERKRREWVENIPIPPSIEKRGQGALSLWNSYLASRSVDFWTEAQLQSLARLVVLEMKLDDVEENIVDLPDYVLTPMGGHAAHPKFAVYGKLHQRRNALLQDLGLSARDERVISKAIDSKETGRSEEERAAGVRDAADGSDGLLAPSMDESISGSTRH